MSLLRRRHRPVTGRGAGPETLDDLTIEAPDGPAGVIVGKARERMRQDGTVPDEDEEPEQEATADPPADQPRAATEAASVPAGTMRDLRVTALSLGRLLSMVNLAHRGVGEILTLAHEFATQPDQSKMLEARQEPLLRALESADRHGAQVLEGLAQLAEMLNDDPLRRFVADTVQHLERTRPVIQYARPGPPPPAGAPPGTKRAVENRVERRPSATFPGGPPPEPSASGAQLLPPPAGRPEEDEVAEVDLATGARRPLRGSTTMYRAGAGGRDVEMRSTGVVNRDVSAGGAAVGRDVREPPLTKARIIEDILERHSGAEAAIVAHDAIFQDREEAAGA